MKYCEFVNILKNKGIDLFDYEYRISYNNINNFNNIYNFNNNEQKGGGKDKVKQMFEYKDKNDLNIIVNLSLSSNPLNLYSLLVN